MTDETQDDEGKDERAPTPSTAETVEERDARRDRAAAAD